jgi:hypothetical protein
MIIAVKDLLLFLAFGMGLYCFIDIVLALINQVCQFVFDMITLRFIWDKNFVNRYNQNNINVKLAKKIKIKITLVIMLLISAIYFWRVSLSLALALVICLILRKIHLKYRSQVAVTSAVNRGVYSLNDEKKLSQQASTLSIPTLTQQSSVSIFDEFTTCQICFENYDHEIRMPLLLPCKIFSSILLSVLKF